MNARWFQKRWTLFSFLYMEWSSIRLDGYACGIVTKTTQNASGGSGEGVGGGVEGLRDVGVQFCSMACRYI